MKIIYIIIILASLLAYPQNNIFVQDDGKLQIYDLEKNIIKKVIVDDNSMIINYKVIGNKLFVSSQKLKNFGYEYVIGSGNWQEDSALIKITKLSCGTFTGDVSPDKSRLIYYCSNNVLNPGYPIDKYFLYDIQKNQSSELIEKNILGWFDNEHLIVDKDSMITLLNINNKNLTEFINKSNLSIEPDALNSIARIDKDKVLIKYMLLPYYYHLAVVNLYTWELTKLPHSKFNIFNNNTFRMWANKIVGIIEEKDENQTSHNYLWITDINGNLIAKKTLEEIFQITNEVGYNNFILSQNVQNNRIVIGYSNFKAPNNKEGYYFLNLNDYTLERIPLIIEKPETTTYIEVH